MLAAKLYHEVPEDLRQSPRRTLAVDATLRAQSLPHDAVVHDLSRFGFSAEVDAPVPVGAHVWLGLVGIGMREAELIRAGGGRIGCRFLQPLSDSEVAGASEGETLVSGAFGTFVAPVAEHQRRADDRWPLRARVGFIVGTSLGLWAGIGLSVYALIH